MSPPPDNFIISDSDVAVIFDMIEKMEEAQWILARDKAILLLFYRHRLTSAQVEALKIEAFDGLNLSVWETRQSKMKVIHLKPDVAGAIDNYLKLLPVRLRPVDLMFRGNRDLKPLHLFARIQLLRRRAQEAGLVFSPKIFRNSSLAHEAEDIDSMSVGDGETRPISAFGRDTPLGPLMGKVFLSYKALHPRWKR